VTYRLAGDDAAGLSSRLSSLLLLLRTRGEGEGVDDLLGCQAATLSSAAPQATNPSA